MKDLYIEEYDRLTGEYEEAGHSPAEAAGMAADQAYAAMTDRLADMADNYRQRAKDEAHG